ncbi:hypothetical protein H4219_004294 [Mycoemilia scoparia]|uniref:Uncharacterized protein n=1 Tax=Mycoemilia scoparia TaxID=417184 RepID=A0A9W8DRL3_9FUNG|nr:hypothetical protein H4219_004294 [Mycoemilia scoparia]
MVFHYSYRNCVTQPFPIKDVSTFVFDALKNNLDDNDWESKKAVISGITSESLTYKEIYDMSNKLASGFQNILKLKRGDVIFSLFDNHVNMIPLFHATIMAGCIYSMAMPEYPEFELALRLTILKPKVIITTKELLDKVKATISLVDKDILEDNPYKIYLLEDVIQPQTSPKEVNGNDRGEKGNSEENEMPLPQSIFTFMSDEEFDPLVISNEEEFETTAVIGFSSGTTGKWPPKGIEIPHRALVSCAYPELCHDTVAELRALQDNTTIVGMPMGVAYGILLYCVRHLSQGTTTIASFAIPLETIFENISKYQVRDINISPFFIEIIRDSWRDVYSKYDTSTVKNFYSSGAPLTYDASNFVEKEIGVPIHSLYGSSECFGIASLRVTSYTETRGQPLSGVDIKILDTRGKELGANQVGEMWIKSRTRMKSYYGNPEATKKAFDEDGFYCLGDIGMIDDDGNIHLYGRKSDMIYYHDKIIFPIEIETKLNSYPGVTYSCVVGVYNPEHKTEVPYAYIVSNIANPGDDTTEIVNWVNEQLTTKEHHLSHGAEYIKELPKSTAGKLFRYRLKQMYYESRGIEPLKN